MRGLAAGCVCGIDGGVPSTLPGFSLFAPVALRQGSLFCPSAASGMSVVAFSAMITIKVHNAAKAMFGRRRFMALICRRRQGTRAAWRFSVGARVNPSDVATGCCGNRVAEQGDNRFETPGLARSVFLRRPEDDGVFRVAGHRCQGAVALAVSDADPVAVLVRHLDADVALSQIVGGDFVRVSENADLRAGRDFVAVPPADAGTLTRFAGAVVGHEVAVALFHCAVQGEEVGDLEVGIGVG